MSSSTCSVATSPSSEAIAKIFNSLERTERAAFITPSSSFTWAEWMGLVAQLLKRCSPLRRARVGLSLRPSGEAYAALIALSCLECDIFLFDPGITSPMKEHIAGQYHVDMMIDPTGDPAWPASSVGRFDPATSFAGRGQVTIFTSGSTGQPKPVHHDWNSLTRSVRKTSSTSPQRWLLTYRPHLFAGLQVFSHCFLNQETLVAHEQGAPVEAVVDLMVRSSVTSVSATPSYWRRLITQGMPADLRSIPLQQITLGGEIADEQLLAALDRLYPNARLVHLYATSELGRCFSVKDRRAGFPASFLDATSDDGVALKLEDGELYVRSSNAMIGSGASTEVGASGAQWLPTGDLIEQVGDRCFFAGRRNDIINVGGNKVQPLRVEHVIQAIPGVRDVRVFARSSSLVGQMVACEFVSDSGFEPETVRMAINKTCLERLDAHERPRFVQAVSAISLSSAAKKIRNP